MGLVIDAQKGLVVVSRAIVPYDLCDITITIADSIFVEAKVVFLHPLQNYCIIQYDPNLVDAPVQSAKLGNTDLAQGAETHFVGYRAGRFVHAATTVTEIRAVVIPANSDEPRYRALNVDGIYVDTTLAGRCRSGALVGADGTVQALWLTFLGKYNDTTKTDEEYYVGMATPTLLPVISQQSIVPKLRMLPVEFRNIAMSTARVMGVSDEWIEMVTIENKSRHELFKVQTADEKGALRVGDILLTLNSKIVTKTSDLDVMYSHDYLDAEIVREGQQITIQIGTVLADGIETHRAIYFCGAIFQRPHLAVRQRISKLPSEVYVSQASTGSPTRQYDLVVPAFVTHVNGISTKDLNSFLATVEGIPDNTCKLLVEPALPF
jgi:pro-apoptotic serine protease NMA111